MRLFGRQTTADTASAEASTPQLGDLPTNGQATSADRPDESAAASGLQTATFAAGCFWGVEATFAQTPGVVSTRVGYTGGDVPDPTYRQVCSDRTGHAEAIEVRFDPARVSYDQLLNTFWRIHDPTTLNRQGPDVGTQYRSAIFVHGDGQLKAATTSRDHLQAALKRPIVTQIVPATTFWQAEDYHQRYFERHNVACHLPA